MIKYHPDINMLVEYTSGSLPWAQSLAVGAHLQMCAHCRQHSNQMVVLGGVQLASATQEAINNDSFNRVLDRIRKSANTATPATELAQPKKSTLPALPSVIEKLVPAKLRWQKVSSSLAMARLITGQNQYEVAFHKIAKGGKVVEHDHKGVEITLVLEGSFSDENGIYQAGDFLVKEPGHIHRPTAALNQDCLCLSVCEAPVKVTGFLGKILNPFLKIKPA